jgi:DNA primase large subunit
LSKWDEWHQRLATAADDLVKTEEIYKRAELARKRVYAEEYQKGRAKGLSQKDADVNVVTTAEYNHITELEIEAYSEWKNAKYRYERGKIWMDTHRTLEASRRAEMNLT